MIFLKGDDFEGGRLKGAKLRLFNKLPSPHKQSTIHYLVSIFGYSEASWLREANFNYLNHFQHTLVLPHPHSSNELIMLYHWVLGKKNFEKQGMVSTVYLPLPFLLTWGQKITTYFLSFFLSLSFSLSLLFLGGWWWCWAGGLQKFLSQGLNMSHSNDITGSLNF